MIYYEDIVEKINSVEKSIFSKIKITDLEDLEHHEIEANNCFCKHLISTKQWFLHISWINKRQFLINLLKELNIQTVSQLLKSIWNCRTKDMIMSISQHSVYTSYDQVPMDHNRTAQHKSTLNEVMMSETKWFISLDSVHRILCLSELLTVAGGPLMWEVLKFCQQIYDEYAEEQNLLDIVVATDTQDKISSIIHTLISTEQPKKEVAGARQSLHEQKEPKREQTQNPLKGARGISQHNEQKELETQLASWTSKMKSMRDGMKLQEMEVILRDGTKRYIWKNRIDKSKLDTSETVDLIQLLPSHIGKKIIMYLTPSEWGDCSRVNKYWAYLVDEIRSDLTTRNKLNLDLEKMRANIERHNTELGLETHSESTTTSTSSSISTRIMKKKTIIKGPKKHYKIKKPILTVAELYGRLNRRGAADAHIWAWCSKVLKFYKEINVKVSGHGYGGLMILGDSYFPCPMMGHSINLPLAPPLTKDLTK